MVQHKCLSCGTAFTSDSRDSKYCSRSCGLTHATQFIVKQLVCTRCGVSFQFTGRTKAKYCSTCRKAVNVENVMRSKKNKIPSTLIGVGSGGHQVRYVDVTWGFGPTPASEYQRICSSFWPRRCVACSSDAWVLVHHVNGDHDDNRASNLIPLCTSCHRTIHATATREGKPLDVVLENAVPGILVRLRNLPK